MDVLNVPLISMQALEMVRSPTSPRLIGGILECGAERPIG